MLNGMRPSGLARAGEGFGGSSCWSLLAANSWSRGALKVGECVGLPCDMSHAEAHGEIRTIEAGEIEPARFQRVVAADRLAR